MQAFEKKFRSRINDNKATNETPRVRLKNEEYFNQQTVKDKQMCQILALEAIKF